MLSAMNQQKLLDYVNQLIRAGFHFAAVCVLQQLPELPARAHLMCVCALALKDRGLLDMYKGQCTGHLRQLCERVSDYRTHTDMAAMMRAYVAGAAPLVETERRRLGLLIPAGGARLLTQLIANLTSLRNTGCSLPVSVVHASELSVEQQRDLRVTFAVDFVDISLLMPANDWRGFQIKLAALAVSPFETTILADADILWVRDPTALYDRMRDGHAQMLLFSDFWH